MPKLPLAEIVVQDDEGRQVARLEAFLEREGVLDIVPTYQLLRTNAPWRGCKVPKFAVPPKTLWDNMPPTLRLLRRVVIPAIGEVEVVSVYRNPTVNACIGGAKASAHVKFYALDMIPSSTISSVQVVRRLCAIHKAHGAKYQMGLGFYNVARFHIDTRKFRRWGADYKGPSSPCAKMS